MSEPHLAEERCDACGDTVAHGRLFFMPDGCGEVGQLLCWGCYLKRTGVVADNNTNRGLDHGDR